MRATFLSASSPLTKTFALVNGQLEKTSHPRVIDCSSYEHEFDDIETLHNLFLAHAEAGHCFLKGNVTRQLVNESRAGATDLNEPTRVLLLDLDGLKQVPDVESFLAQIKLGDVDYIAQYSCSMGVIPERGISAHLCMLIDKPWFPSMLKQWLTAVNLGNPVLRQNLGLTKTNNALRWALDVSTCQNDKLIYIAPPILGEGVKDHFSGERIQLVKKAKRFAELDAMGPVPSAEANRVKIDEALNELRERAGLPVRKHVHYKDAGPIRYMAKPDQATVTGVKKERGFVYLNLNNGDSWGYYHPEGNPEFILNFKDEPIYRTSELLPEYWMDVKEVIHAPRFDEQGVLHLAFRDFRTAAYWNGTWNRKTNDLVLAQARSSDQLRSFLMQHGQPVGEFVPDWHVSFDPHSGKTVDVESKSVNLFQPSKYMRMKPRTVIKVPPVVKKVIMHALGDDEEAFEHFMNWLAVIIQYKCRTMTAWVLHGTQGTGKGIMLNFILRPIFGMDYVVSKRMEELDSQFNGFMERCFILFLDEAQLSSFGRRDVMDANFKNYIVEPMISIRRMHTMPYEVANYLNLIFASNKPDPVIIDPEDRRFNVAVYQPNRLKISDAELEALEGELEEFYHYLATRTADKAAARLPLNNPAKQKMVLVGRTGMDVVCEAVSRGDFAFLWDQRPTSHLKEGSGNTSQDIMAGKYIRLLDEIYKGKHQVITRDELQDILAYTIGGVPSSPYKFTSTIKHHGIMLEPMSKGGKTVRGIKVDWAIPEEIKGEMKL